MTGARLPGNLATESSLKLPTYIVCEAGVIVLSPYAWPTCCAGIALATEAAAHAAEGCAHYLGSWATAAERHDWRPGLAGRRSQLSSE